MEWKLQDSFVLSQWTHCLKKSLSIPHTSSESVKTIIKPNVRSHILEKGAILCSPGNPSHQWPSAGNVDYSKGSAESVQSTAGPAALGNTERAAAAAFASVGQLELPARHSGTLPRLPLPALELQRPSCLVVPARCSWAQPPVAGHRLCTTWCGTPERTAPVAQVQALLYLTPPRPSRWYFLSSCNATTALPTLRNHIYVRKAWAKVPRYKVKCEPVTSVCK